MISILVVDDEEEKRRVLAEVLLATPGVTESSLTFASSVFEAKKKLQERGFDLMLLDINLPKRVDQHPVADGGLEILRWLKTRGKTHRPHYIVGTSAYPDALDFRQSSLASVAVRTRQQQLATRAHEQRWGHSRRSGPTLFQRRNDLSHRRPHCHRAARSRACCDSRPTNRVGGGRSRA